MKNTTEALMKAQLEAQNQAAKLTEEYRGDMTGTGFSEANKIPQGTLEDIEKISNNFYWGKGPESYYGICTTAMYNLRSRKNDKN
jgi:hypothetical protein